MYEKRKVQRSRFELWWRRYEYKHTTLATIAVLAFILLLDTALVQAFLLSIREWGLVGIFFAGILFVSFFTAAPSVAMLLAFADNFNPIIIALVAGAGSIIGDWIILYVIEEKVGYELKPIAQKYGLMPTVKTLKSRAFRPLAVIIGALFIASPLPDEVGLGLLGITKMAPWKLLSLTFVLNTAGILLLILGVRAIGIV